MKKVFVILVSIIVVTVTSTVMLLKTDELTKNSKSQQIDIELNEVQNDYIQQIDAELCKIEYEELQVIQKVREAYQQRSASDTILSLREEMFSTQANHQAFVSNLLDSLGWPDNLSDSANRAIFHVIQHAPLSFKEKYSHLLKEARVPFFDFTIVDLNAKPVRLSERITGKPAVLHLWSSTCLPCRKKAKELIPVYEEFRDKGFVVVGVAHEKNISTAEAAIRVDKYPWENLVELNDVEQIRLQYGIAGSLGSHFLIDEKGKIIVVAPSNDEIREFLLGEL